MLILVHQVFKLSRHTFDRAANSRMAPKAMCDHKPEEGAWVRLEGEVCTDVLGSCCFFRRRFARRALMALLFGLNVRPGDEALS